jgi:hypothetical protein
VSMPEPPEGRLLIRLGQLVGLLAGAVTVVYLTGALVIVVRLSMLSFQAPSTVVAVPQLPREVVISVGLTSVVLWMLVASASYFAVRLLTPLEGTPPTQPLLAAPGGSAAWVLKRALGFTAVVAVVYALVIGSRWLDGDGPAFRPAFISGLVGSLLIFLFIIVAYDLRSRLALRYPTVSTWNSLPAVSLTAALVAMPIAPAAALISGSVPLPPAKVCAKGYSEVGYLIGQTSDQVIIGEHSSRRRVASIPAAGVEELFVGTGAFEATCPPQSHEASNANRRAQGVAQSQGHPEPNADSVHEAFKGAVVRHPEVPNDLPKDRLCLVRYTARRFGAAELGGHWWTSCQTSQRLDTVIDVKERLALPARFGPVRDVRVKANIPGGTHILYLQGKVAPQCEHREDPLPCIGHRYEGGSEQYYFADLRPLENWITKTQCTRAREDAPSHWFRCKG